MSSPREGPPVNAPQFPDQDPAATSALYPKKASPRVTPAGPPPWHTRRRGWGGPELRGKVCAPRPGTKTWACSPQPRAFQRRTRASDPHWSCLLRSQMPWLSLPGAHCCWPCLGLLPKSQVGHTPERPHACPAPTRPVPATTAVPILKTQSRGTAGGDGERAATSGAASPAWSQPR